MIPAGLTAVLARIGAIQSRFAPPGAASNFSDVLDQVTGATSGTPAGGASSPVDLSSIPEKERQMIVDEARKEGIDPALALAMVLKESGGNPQAVSPAGAMGLMQLMPGTAQELGVTHPFDPAQNLAGGLDYFRQKLSEFGSVPLALAAYNAGSSAVSAYGGVPPYAQTQAYVAGVLAARDQIARALATGTAAAPAASGAAQRGTHGTATGSGSGAARPAPSGSAGPAGSSSPSSSRANPRTVQAPASPAGTKPAAADTEHPDGGLPGTVLRQVTDGAAAIGRDGASANAADGGSAAAGAAVVRAALGDPASSNAGIQGTGQHGSDAAAAFGALLHASSGQNQGAGNQGVGQGAGQAPQQGGAAASSVPSSTGETAPAVAASTPLRSPDGAAAGAPGSAVSHVTVRSGGDAPVTVTLTDRAAAVSGRVVTPTPVMAQTLQEHVSSLRAALASHQVRLSDLTVRPATADRPPHGQHGSHARTPRSARTFAAISHDAEEEDAT